MSIEAWIAAGGLFVTILTVSGTGLRILFTKLEANKDHLSRRVDNAREQSSDAIGKLRDEVEADARDVRELVEARAREAGEIGHALREKISQVELFVRDEFVKQEHYNRDQERVLRAIEQLDKSNELRMKELRDELKQLFSEKLNARSPN